MSWVGKFVGGTLGFALGGRLGAVAGAAFGHAFDSSEEKPHYSGQMYHLSNGEETQFTFFVAAFSMLAKIVRLDGRISREEIASIEKFMEYDLKLNMESKRLATNIFSTALESNETFESFAIQFYEKFRIQPQLLEVMIDILLRVSVADGAMSSDEERMIRSAANIFQFGEEKFRTLKSRYIAESEKYYTTLGCGKNDPDEQVKKRYRKLVLEFHPDKIASKGLPEEFTKFAEDKFREIQEAYEVIKRERGMK